MKVHVQAHMGKVRASALFDDAGKVVPLARPWTPDDALRETLGCACERGETCERCGGEKPSGRP